MGIYRKRQQQKKKKKGKISGHDFVDSYSPTIQADSLRLTIALFAIYD